MSAPTETTKLVEGGSERSRHSHHVDIPPDELAELLSCTNFTEREIEGFYKYSNSSSASRADFAKLCADNGITAKGLMERMWDVFDIDSNGEVSNFELVKGLNPLLRGSREQVAGMFFDLYEVDGDGELTAPEIIAVYSDMVLLTEQEREIGLTSFQKRRIWEWVAEQQERNKANGGKLDRETFIQAIIEMESETGHKKPTLCSPRNIWFIFLTAWFEVGTSFALPAMGAISDRIKLRMDITDEGIGQLTSAYFFAAMIGPMVGGVLMDKYGPENVVIWANLCVVLGCFLQAYADGPEMYNVLMAGRFLLGFGGETTPFTTVEILGRLFPDHFGLMAGVRNLEQSGAGFLAFFLLPRWADNASKYEDDNDGTTFALYMCMVLGVVSTVACIIVKFSMSKEQINTEQQSDQATITRTMRAFSKATSPKIPGGLEKWMLPVSFYLAVIGIKAQYFAPFGFTAFSNKLYEEKFGRTEKQASFLTGFISLVAGFLGPIFGPLSDTLGQRSISLFIFTGLSGVGFVILALAKGGATPVWIASVLFAVQYGFGDTVAYVSIRLIAGLSRAGVGYGIYGLLGNLLGALVPVYGGKIFDLEDGNELLCWYFAALMFFSALCWIGVLILEGTRSLMEMPADKVIETSDEDLQVAALSYVVGSKRKSVRA